MFFILFLLYILLGNIFMLSVFKNSEKKATHTEHGQDKGIGFGRLVPFN